MQVYTLDLSYQNVPGTIAAYLIPHSGGAALVESGPGSTQVALQAGLAEHGFSTKDVTDVLLTHIHLDHAGAAGWLARQGARIHVHHVGAPHLIDPTRLLASAGRIYGDQMEKLWGQFLPVPEEQISIVNNEDVVEIGKLCFRALDTPGHASHHMAYLLEDTCFSGDIGGVRLNRLRHIRLPTPPPEFNLEAWRQSLARLRKENFRRIAPTHFGIFDDADWHLAELERELDRLETWMESTLSNGLPPDQIRQEFAAYEIQRSQDDRVDPLSNGEFELANPTFMSADGIARYWQKYRAIAES